MKKSIYIWLEILFNQCLEVEEYTVDELTDMIYAGKINDAKTIAAIMAYKNKYINIK